MNPDKDANIKSMKYSQGPLYEDKTLRKEICVSTQRLKVSKYVNDRRNEC